ncbi:MAG: 4Fe-4S dicluster domain-containing protein [Candidatus Methanosuratincola petrocarbonis]
MIRVKLEELLRLPSILKDMGYRVIAPVEGNGVTKFAEYSPGLSVVLDYVRAINAPRDFLLPDGESLYRYRSTATVTSYGLKIRFPTVEGPCPVTINAEYTAPIGRLAFFAIHPCHANSIKYLDRVMLSEPADPYYRARREGMLAVVLECEEGDDFCFCVPAGSWKADRECCDVLVRRARSKSSPSFSPSPNTSPNSVSSSSFSKSSPVSSSGDYFIVQPISEAGKQAVSRLSGQEEPGSLEVEEEPPKMRALFSIRASEENIDRGAAENLDSCTLCAACTVTCPTCYCSDIEDRFHLVDPSNVERVRRRMSCQRRCYSMIAGGTVFLKSKEERYRWRLKHKFPFSEKSFGVSGCVGCGNCIAFCPAGVDMRRTVGRSDE